MFVCAVLQSQFKRFRKTKIQSTNQRSMSKKNLNCKRLPISSAVNNALRGSAQSFCFASESQSLRKRTCSETCNVLLAFRMLQCIRINTPHGVVLRNGQQSFQSGSNELQHMKTTSSPMKSINCKTNHQSKNQSNAIPSFQARQNC